MIDPTWDTLRLFLHVLAATLWVGGQLVLAALVPALRRAGPEIPAAAARAYNRVAWPAFGVLIATGVWNIVAERDEVVGAYRTTLVVKLVLVALSGAAAWVHIQSTTAASRAVFGSLTALTALAALLLGVLLAG